MLRDWFALGDYDGVAAVTALTRRLLEEPSLTSIEGRRLRQLLASFRKQAAADRPAARDANV